MDKKIFIIIIEDHPVMRDGLASRFAGTGRWNVTRTASSLAEAKEMFLLLPSPAEVALLDIQLEDGWSLDIILWLAARNIKSPLAAVYSSFDDYAHINAALGMGVRACVSKKRDEREFEAALQTVLRGGLHIDSAAAAKFHNVTDIISLLTKREAEILTL